MIIFIGVHIKNVKAQDYDGESTVLCSKSGVGTQSQIEHPSVFSSHFLCHSLNSGVASVNRVSRSMKDMMDACV